MTETRELLRGREEKSTSPNKGSLICPLGKSMISYEKKTEKIELVPRPVTNQSSKRSSKRKSSCIHSLKTGNFNFLLSGPKYKGRYAIVVGRWLTTSLQLTKLGR